jgi:hypothetical protein
MGRGRPEDMATVGNVRDLPTIDFSLDSIVTLSRMRKCHWTMKFRIEN